MTPEEQRAVDRMAENLEQSRDSVNMALIGPGVVAGAAIFLSFLAVAIYAIMN